jgi:hypothetical protein
LDGRRLPWEGEFPAETGDAKDSLPSARSGSREDALYSEGSEGIKPELANAKLPLQPPDNQDRIDFRRDVGGHYNANLEEDYRPPVPGDGGEQHKNSSIVSLQV